MKRLSKSCLLMLTVAVAMTAFAAPVSANSVIVKKGGKKNKEKKRKEAMKVIAELRKTESTRRRPLFQKLEVIGAMAVPGTVELVMDEKDKVLAVQALKTLANYVRTGKPETIQLAKVGLLKVAKTGPKGVQELAQKFVKELKIVPEKDNDDDDKPKKG